MFAHDTSPPRPAFFNEGKSTPTRSNPSSLKSFSMKGKISFISGLLSKSTSRANIRENVSKPLSDAGPEFGYLDNEKVESQNATTRAIQHEKTEPIDKKNATQSYNDRPNRSLTIAKRLSTTFRRPSQSPHPASHVPIPSVRSKQLREAALRERGLLPPKDMSAQELEQDNQIASVAPAPQILYADGLSEADRIKQAWEAKIQPNDTAGQEESPDSVLEATVHPAKAENANGSLDSNSAPPPSPKPTSSIRKSLSRAHLAQAKPPPTRELPPTPLDPECIPLPPSPLEDASSIRSAELSYADVSLSPSCGSATSPPITITAESLPEEVNSHPNSAQPSLSHTHTLHPGSPVTSLSPSTTECSSDGALAPPELQNRSRPSVIINNCSDSDESGSIAAPSLATSSQLTSESPCSYTTHKFRPDPLAKTWTNEPSVPVIIESPVEGNGLVIPINDDIPDQEADDMATSFPSRAKYATTNGKHKQPSFIPSTGAQKASSGKLGGKMSRSGSLANFRHSVVSTLTRKPTKSHSLNFDTSTLPPSPTVPASLGSHSSISAQSANSKNSNVESTRQALSPTIHSRGSILFETSHIEDEETRRMTEMAFMG
ncbi:hypothetical protein DFJ43DRAFT_1095136 [Lentinula guzmanii]|uniref:Uncharacterized protein n=1 Tax=Lentinula guzmanii TaxID=2804957 RepID=A0AA38JCZ3_9AGAR|nr:hypothetical protein DFJ43DRAFT_1095136 [Lentinula guzmanii]